VFEEKTYKGHCDHVDLLSLEFLSSIDVEVKKGPQTFTTLLKAAKNNFDDSDYLAELISIATSRDPKISQLACRPLLTPVFTFEGLKVQLLLDDNNNVITVKVPP
jgi:hypothetical protein